MTQRAPLVLVLLLLLAAPAWPIPKAAGGGGKAFAATIGAPATNLQIARKQITSLLGGFMQAPAMPVNPLKAAGPESSAAKLAVAAPQRVAFSGAMT